MTFDINLEWKSFNVNIQAVYEWLIANVDITIPSQKFIMVTCNINYTGAILLQPENFVDDFKMCKGEIFFTELPAINNISVKNKKIGRYTFQVMDNFLEFLRQN